MGLIAEAGTLYNRTTFEEGLTTFVLEEVQNRKSQKGLKDVVLSSSLSFDCLKAGFLEKSQQLYKEAVSNAFDHISDAILVCESTRTVLFVEMKSECTSHNMAKARAQIVASYLKLYIHLGFFSSVQWSSYRFKGLVISLKPTYEQKVNCEKEAAIPGRLLARFMYRLCLSTVPVPPVTSDLCELKNLRLRNEVKDSLNIELHYYGASSANGESVSLDPYFM